MTPKAAPSSSFRWSLALGGLVGLAAIVLLLGLFLRKKTAPRSVDAGPAAASSPASRPLPDIATRPRAGFAGRVVDAEHRPLAGAAVCAWVSREHPLTTAEKQTPRCATSDARGDYAVVDLYPETALLISVAAPKFLPAGYAGPDGEGTLRLAAGERRVGIDFTLVSGGVPIKGRVSDATGGVIAGAVVVVDAIGAAGRPMATSDERGEFLLWGAPGQVHLGATATGYAAGQASGPAPGHFFELFLLPGATLVGRTVLAGTETPVSGVLTDAIQVEGGNARASSRSGDEGRFRIEGLLPGRYRVEATSERREGYSRSSVTLGIGETSSEVIIELEPAYAVVGRVLVKATGEPCPGGEVTLTDPKQDEFSQGGIQPDGSVRMASVIPGAYQVSVRCKGHVSAADYPPVTIRDQDAPPQLWEVEQGATVRVSVVDGQGQAVSAARVSAHGSGPQPSSGSAERPEADGSFLIAGLSPGPHRVIARTPDGSQGMQMITVDARREERVKIELPLSGGIEGVVEYEDHRPAANVTVRATGPRGASARSLDDGSFSLTGLPMGEYLLHAGDGAASRGSSAQQGGLQTRVTVAPPARVRARLVVERRTGVIEGRVTDASGAPVTDAFLDYAEAGRGVTRWGTPNHAPVVTDPEGRFKIDGLADGAYDLRASRKGGGEASAENISAGSRSVALRLAEGASISGLLTLPKGGEAVERFSVEVVAEKSGFRRSELFFRARGAFTLRDLPAGAYKVTAETPLGTASAEVTLAEGEQRAGLSLTMALRGTVELRLVALEGGGAVDGMRVQITDAGGGGVRPEPPGPDGRFRVEGVLGGKGQLSVSTSGEAGAAFDDVSLPIEVNAGGGVTDLGAVRVPRRRVAAGGPVGALGLSVKEAAGEAAGSGALEVDSVTGPAAEAKIQVGDSVASVDGFDVRGPNRYLFVPLTTVPPGRTVSLGMTRGGTVSVTASGAP